jgi:hypothetical protein
MMTMMMHDQFTDDCRSIYVAAYWRLQNTIVLTLVKMK